MARFTERHPKNKTKGEGPSALQHLLSQVSLIEKGDPY